MTKPATGTLENDGAKLYSMRLHTLDEAAATFADAALAYMRAGGERKYVRRILEHFGDVAISKVDQAAIDVAAGRLYPAATAATQCWMEPLLR
jgi:hypothetical protein